ncbi:hypothetical protein LTR04_001587 [Oleoguttula sp. CCFEE 6159]|nr:hypothetical protein LTR04_001587 [Oleoguttula sp. CCFEE 6159]
MPTGCCASTSRNPRSSPYDNTTPTSHANGDSSRANITHSSSPPRSRSFASHSHPADSPRISINGAPSARSNARKTTRPNQPLRAPSPVPASPAHNASISAPWTIVQLARERDAFFDTRVTGHPEVWNAVRLVTELVRSGDLSSAQGVLDAAGCTCPSGTLRRGVYDERGVLYEVPAWVVADPDDLVTSDDVKEAADDDAASEDLGMKAEDDAAAVRRRRDEKGKGRAADLGVPLKVRARLSDRGTDLLVHMRSEQSVGVLVRRVQEMSGLSKTVKIGFLGRILDEGQSLGAQGWREGMVVNALVFG